MNEINQTPPDRMTQEQRVDEIAALLAAALVRLRTAPSAPSAPPAPPAETSAQRHI